MKAIHIQTEYLHNPLGIDVQNPRIFWNCEGGIRQTAYRIKSVNWDSGKVLSSKMWATYPMPVSSGERVEFTVSLWDENDTEGEESEVCFFEMGLLHPADWSAKWITGDYEPDDKLYKKKSKIEHSFFLQGVDFLKNAKKGNPVERYPVDCFRKRFSVENGIQKARLYITACGVYQASLNGERVGDFILAPGITDYKKRIQYQTYDVTAMLQRGENSLTVDLADGWYRGAVGAWGLLQEYGYETKLLAQLEIQYTDGKTQTILSDATWDWSNDGPIRFADNKDGEIVDGNRVPSYNGSAKVTSCTVVPTASDNVPITEHERFSAKLMTTPSGKTILDFSQNMAGSVEFTILAHKGDKIHLRFGEMLDSDGEFTQKNIQCVNGNTISPKQEVYYTCKEGLNHYKTSFAIFGFRYVLVESDTPIRPENFTAIAVYSDMAQTGFFESSNDLLNKFVQATIWSTKSNSADIPTDCPTRERHGWTGDAQIFFGTASYLFDYATFSKKFLRDVFDWQKADGKLPQIAPPGGIDFFMERMNGSVGWADIGILLPYRFFRKYGDHSILEEYYERMRKYADFMISRIGKNDILSIPHRVKGKNRGFIVNKGQAYGEWAEPADVYPNSWTNMVFPEPETATAYTSFVLGIMGEIAETLGKHIDAGRYGYYSEHCKTAYNALVETKGNELDTDRQAKLVRPLYMHLLDEEKTAYAQKRLVQALENYGWRLGTGFLSTPFILDVLTEIDPAYAYRLLENEKMPGWLFMPKMGATTIWESWEGTEAQGGIASLNHYSKGAVCEWLFSTMCGIQIGAENHFTIAPLPGGTFTFAKVEYKSIYGLVQSGWQKTESGYTYEITIPANTTADIILPGGTVKAVTAGTYILTEKDEDA